METCEHIEHLSQESDKRFEEMRKHSRELDEWFDKRSRKTNAQIEKMAH